MSISLDKASHQVIEISLKGLEIFSIFSSVFSIVLGVVAIWLSVVFYKWSVKSSREMEKSSNAIDSNVKRLEVLFDKMYTDTFGMVKETVSDMRQYVYKSNGSAEAENKKIQSEIEQKTKVILDDAIKELQDDKLSKSDVEVLVKKIIQESTNIVKEMEHKTYIEQIKKLLELNGTLTYPQLRKKLLIKQGEAILFRVLEEMVELGLIYDPFEEDEDGAKIITHSEKIRLYKEN
jgi:hypothetical protein